MRAFRREPVAERAGTARREPLERERTRGKPAQEKRYVHRARARDHVVGHILVRASAKEPVTRIRYPRIAAVGAKRHLAASIHGRNDGARDALLVALPIGDHLRARDAEMRKQLPRAARIFAGDQARRPETFKRPHAHVSEISDWRGHNMQHRLASPT